MLKLFLLTVVALGCSAQGMLGFPAGCDRSSCTVYAQWRVVSTGTIQFELEGTADGWVAFGASADAVMGTDGIDDVFVCQRDATTDTVVYAEDTYNPEDQPLSARTNMRDSNQTGFNQISTSFTNGRIFCTFARSLSTGDLIEDRDLSEPVFVLLSVGGARGGPEVAIDGHTFRAAASTAVLLTSTSGQIGIAANLLLSILMSLAGYWVVATVM